VFKRKYYEVWYDITDFRKVKKTDRRTQFSLTKKEALDFAKARSQEEAFSNIRVVRVRKRIFKRYK